MNTIHDLIRLIRTNLARLRTQGAGNVAIESLESLLNQVERDIPPAGTTTALPINVRLEAARLEQEHALTVYSEQNASAIAMFKSVITTAIVCARALLLMNGASAVALLAFIGHLATDATTQNLIPQFSPALELLLYGVLTAASFSGFLAFAQWAYNKKWMLVGHINSAICILSGAASLALFIVGARCGAHALQGFAVRQSMSLF